MADDIDFNRDIRPILSDHCFPCHGPDANQRQADLRLDLESGLFADLGGYAPFVANDVDASEALQRVMSDDPYERMPPEDANLELSEEQKQLLQKWVRQGAEWREHWSFVVPKKPQLPAVKQDDWPHNPIDYFVLAQLEKRGWAPSPQAIPESLIRRVTLDLTGLPPTPETVAAFVADPSSAHYERLVDRLLASPRYGERMAWPWLDAARYADTDGFQADPTRDMWPWRDWLVEALNNNMPFDQFTTEMLAGDLLPDATTRQILASGFNRNHMYNGEGGRIPEETRIENVFDRTETTATIWMGLTMTCARCHDHKFDPISQQDYYQLFAFFNNTSESGAGGSGRAAPTIRYYSPEQQTELDSLNTQIAAIDAEMNRPDEELDRKQSEWESTTVSELRQLDDTAQPISMGTWHQLGPLAAPDGNAQAAFDHVYGPETKTDLTQRFANGTVEWEPKDYADGKVHELPTTIGATFLFREITTPAARSLQLSLGSDDSIQVWLNGQQVLTNNVARGAAADQENLVVDLLPGQNKLLMKIVNTGGRAGFYFDRRAESVAGLPVDVAEILLIETSARSPQQSNRVRDYFRGKHSAQWRQLRSEQATLNAKRQQLIDAAAVVMVMDDLPQMRRRETFVLNRGTYNQPLDPVNCGTPSFLPAWPADTPYDRLGLARWLTAPEHPLTARVTVNRYWQLFFGNGLVETSEDFGRQGTMPTHPELLDWLATHFVESGWDVKRLHKQMVMSSTYRQSSRDPTGHSYEADPDNRWLSRGARFRMPSWMLRDQALALSGLLVEQIGGPPVRPYQPEGIWAEATFGKITYTPGTGNDLYRRSLYTFWRRIVGPTMFFDEGKRQTCVVKPTRTNSPLHALTTLNETTFVEAARGMAERVTEQSRQDGDDSDTARVALAFRLATSREAASNELSRLVKRWRDYRDRYEADPEAAAALLSVGEWQSGKRWNQAELAATTLVCMTILNLDEVLTRE